MAQTEELKRTGRQAGIGNRERRIREVIDKLEEHTQNKTMRGERI